jgi:hypothetical protein
MSFDTASRQRLPTTAGHRRYLLDAALIFLVPVVLSAVFTLPSELKQSLGFRYTDPMLLTAFASSYVHLDLVHLSVNVVGYLLVVPATYLLSVASGARSRFFAVFATLLLVFPLVLSYLNLVFVRPTVGVGFSGVLLAFFGYMPLTMARHLDTRFDIGPERAVAPALFFAGFALIAPLSVRSVTTDRMTVYLGTAGLVVATLLSALLFLLPAVEETRSLRRKIARASSRSGQFELGVVSAALFIAFPFVAFPGDPTGSGTVVNLYLHVLGYALGFTATYATAEAIRALESRDVGNPSG